MESRVRYTFWDLLGDVGGFNDGLILMCSLFMSGFSAFAFNTDFLNKSYYDTVDKPAKNKPSTRKDVYKGVDMVRSNATVSNIQ